MSMDVLNTLIKRLRRSYGAFDVCEPHSPMYQSLQSILERADNATLTVLSRANIKFVSDMAQSEALKRRAASSHGPK